METVQSTDAINSKLRVNLFKLAVKYDSALSNYMLLAEWLGCYQYVLPADRKGMPFELTGELAQRHFKIPSEVFRTWLLVDKAYINLTYEEQIEVGKWIHELNCSALAP